MLFGLGLGLFVAKFLQELELWRFALLGFIAIVLVGRDALRQNHVG